MEDLSLPTTSISPESPELPEALQIPTHKASTGSMLALALAYVALFLCYGNIRGLLLPLQISAIDPAHKVADLGIITSLSVLFALISKAFIIFADVMIAASMLVFRLVPSWSVLLPNVGLLGAGFFVVGAVIALLGIFSVLPIKTVR